ncbi:MAG: beta-galactosidase [Clostridiales bacterium]|nr:beta-galactosidase [Clostridiales bacterium]
MNNTARSEFPNPQFKREKWLCLNGEWDFEFDFGVSGKDSGMLQKNEWSKKINVPFCPESELSGIGYKDFIPAVWYRKKVTLSEDDVKGSVFLCFGAVDYESEVYVNGKLAGTHKGGYTSFKIDISDFVTPGENTIIVNAVDDTRSPIQPTGKQSIWYNSIGCHYTRTTGIWQSVWLEFTSENYIESFKVFPDSVNACVSLSVNVKGTGTLNADVFYEGKKIGSMSKSGSTCIFGEIHLSETHLWEPGNGRLYDIILSFCGDEVKSYFGLRNISLDGYKFLINGKSVFQRLVLDQGFYPDGIYTAPTAQALEDDVILSMNVGFNGARLHQKVFEPLFLYYCDKHGYLVWGEYPNWTSDYSDPRLVDVITNEWVEAVERDFNHPSIIGWCPFNETWDYEGKRQRNELLETVYKITKAIDKTRPCIDTSGNFHTAFTDIYDTHDYEQDVIIFKERYDEFKNGGKLYDKVNDGNSEYKGGPVFVSEYGGIKWSVGSEGESWGYGKSPDDEEEYINRYKGLTDTLLDNDKMFGFCYTQLYDVEQEQNGVYTYRRKAKFPPEILKKINSRKAAIED